MRVCLFAAAVLLAGCVENPSVPNVAKVIVSVPCVERNQIPAQNFIPDSDLAKLDDGGLVISLAEDRLRQREWISTSAALLEACVR